MNMFLCLAITFLLAGLMFIYVRNQMTALESQVLKLTEVVRSVAERDTAEKETQVTDPETPKPTLKKCYVSDDSESESESEEEPEAEPEAEPEEPIESLHIDISQDVKVIPMQIPLQMQIPMQMKAFEINFEELENVYAAPKIEQVEIENVDVEVEEVENKVIDTTPNLESLSMKELKELAALKGGASSLKTKKALVEFLSA